MASFTIKTAPDQRGVGADTGSVFLQFSGWEMADTAAFEKNAQIFLLCVLSPASGFIMVYQNGVLIHHFSLFYDMMEKTEFYEEKEAFFMRKILVGTMTVCLLLGSLVGCGGSEPVEEAANYPALELVDISNMELAAGENETIRYQFPADTWAAGTDGMGTPVVLLKETVNGEYRVNISGKNVGYYGERLEEEFCEEMLEGMKNEPGYEVISAGFRSVNGEPVYYMETTYQFNDEIIDASLASGEWTEEGLEAAGGREVFLETPAVNIVHFHGIVDENCVVYAGAYFDESYKQQVIDTIGVMYQTTEIK